MKKIFFDVGAHDGTDGIRALKTGKYDICYAFEADRRMIDLIKSRIHTDPELKDKYVLVENAVGSNHEMVTFTSFKKTNVGSIYGVNLNTDIVKDRLNDFEIVDTYKIECITLENFCLANSITHIDYLHIDTQGNDFEVIKGLGNFIDSVTCGKLECYHTAPEESLYKNTSNSVHTITEYLTVRNFKCTYEPQSATEGNLTFSKYDAC